MQDGTHKTPQTAPMGNWKCEHLNYDINVVELQFFMVFCASICGCFASLALDSSSVGGHCSFVPEHGMLEHEIISFSFDDHGAWIDGIEPSWNYLFIAVV